MSKHDPSDTTDGDRRTVATTDETIADRATTDETIADRATTGESSSGQTTTEAGESVDLEAEGKAEAKRLLQAVDGDTERGRAEAAVARKREALERLHRHLDEAEQHRRRTGQRIEALEYTIERLDDADDDQLVMQRLEGGVSTSVPAGERETVREDLRERKAQLKQRLDDVEGRIEATRRGLRTDRVALDHLQTHEDMVSDR